MQHLTGDEKLTEDQQRLADAATVDAKFIADRYKRSFPKQADGIESSACWGAVRAAATYRHYTQGDDWGRWRDRRIISEIRDFLRKEQRARLKALRHKSIIATSSVSDDTPHYEDKEWLERALALLPPQHRKLCSLIYTMGLSVRDAGKSLGYTGSHGCKLHREAMKMLKERLAA